ncbi:hypothetical protein C8J57DRAFT_1714684 [Mycena rebaudengoi]|nr:hypothetical protein C8J57DRAFT_1714684 [Mycena rebaudengoi]
MQIIEQVVGPTDYKQIPFRQSYFLQTDYERIGERCWGCLSPDSPVPGLCTDLVDTCFVFVFHCAANGRSTLCHTVSGTDIRVFEAQIRYVVGESPHPVDIIVFRGGAYGIPGFKIRESGGVTLENLEEDLAWASQMVDRIKTPSCTTLIYPNSLEYGLVLVEKSTGKITLPIRPRAHHDGPNPAMLWCFSAAPTPATFTKTELVDAFYRIQSTTSFVSSNFERTPSFEVFDGARRLPIPPSSDDTREIFRIATMHPRFPLFKPIQQSDLDIAMRVLRSGEAFRYATSLPLLLEDVGAFCEVAECRQFTATKCAKCEGAYYCGAEHQRADWKSHKDWCESHRQKPGATLIAGASIGEGKGKLYSGTPWM